MLNRRLLAVLIALILALPAAPGVSFAQGDEEVRLTLDECLRTALEHNLDLVSARKDPQTAEQDIIASEAVFDPELSVGATYGEWESDSTITERNRVSDVVTITSGYSAFDTKTGSLEWADSFTFGGAYSVSLDRTDTSTPLFEGVQNGYFVTSQSTSTSDALGLRYEMPLLQGFGKEVNTEGILLARSGLEQSREDLRLQTMRTMKEVEDAYWDLLATRAALDVARESLKLAQDLYELNRKKVEVGTLAPIEVTQAEAGVASREEDVILAETAVENAEDNLLRLLGVPADSPMWSQSIAPTEQPLFEERAVDVEDALETAMERRPEIIKARQVLRDSELSERVARRNTRHGLSLNVDYTPGRSDWAYSTYYPAVGETTNDSSTDETSRMWSVRLVYAYPLKNRRAKAEYASARITLEKKGVAVQQAEQDIRVDVRTAARNVESGSKRVAAARANTTLQRKTLEAEQRKFENGMSTSFEVLRIQTDLSDARVAEIRAILDYTKALADLERAKGTLLEARGLTLGT